MRIYEEQLTAPLLETLIEMSADWEAENSTYGYRKNAPGDIAGNRIFLAEQDGEILGYLFGHKEKAEQTSSIMPKDTPFFEIEELYVVKNHRNQGTGGKLFDFVQQQMKKEGVPFLLLSTATKNYKRILHFYIDELGMEFWSARLYKKL